MELFNCLECGNKLNGRSVKYCSRNCKEKYKYTKLWIGNEERTCFHCEKPLERPKRKFCCSSHKNIWNHKNKYKYVYQRKSIGRSPESFITSLLRKKSRKETLSKQDVIDLYYKQKGLCAISGVEMTYITNQGKVETNISIDKINPNLPYVINNIQLVCNRVNIMKWDKDINNLLFWCKSIIEENL